ncbi:MAG: TetR/AcrR family transcriptional regulator [Enhydrobacter sp.]|nr:MAG: TetR/AcrR family transcriptional regulator [Enhydrobacter sp.]
MPRRDADDAGGRANQRRRTRKDLLGAAARLMAGGRVPSLEEIALAAMVSRATAYRYFPSLEALLVEAVIDQATLGPERLFEGDASDDPVARLEKVDDALQEVFLGNERGMRLMLAQSLQRAVVGDLPRRQNRRTDLIEAALEPAKQELAPGARDRLVKALALIVGSEGMVVVRDVLQIDPAEARAVKRWAIRVLVEAARRSAGPPS